MALNQSLIKELCEKMQVKRSRVYQKIKEVEDNLPTSKEKAAYVHAHKYGIALSKYLNNSELEEVRTIVKDSNLRQVTVTKREPIKKEISFTLKLDQTFKKINEPMLPANIISQAKKMAQYYPYFYILENSIRNLIITVMTKKYGENWWQNEIKNNYTFKNLCQKVDVRKKDEDEFKWHGKRNAHEIFYVDVEDLKKIVIDYWDYYRNILKNRPWFETALNIINMSRRVIAHNNPLSERDFERIKGICQDWCDQMKKAKEELGV